MIAQGNQIAINICGEILDSGDKIKIDIGCGSLSNFVNRIAIGWSRLGGADTAGLNGSFRTFDGTLIVRNGLIVAVVPNDKFSAKSYLELASQIAP